MYLASILWIASLIAGFLIGTNKNRILLALLLCFFLGPVGLIVTLFISAKAITT